MTAQQSFSTSQDPAVWWTIPILEFLQQVWGTMVNALKFYELSDAINSSLENLHKWYHKTNDTDTYFICLSKCSLWFDINVLMFIFSAESHLEA